MKKRTLFISLALAVIVIGCSAFLLRKKIAKVFSGTTSKNVYASIKLESTTMPAIYNELVAKSNPFTLYGRNNEIVPLLEKMYATDPNNLQLKFTLGLQNVYRGTTQQ
ncbi:MAG: hypothetical protein ACHQD9_06645, partial [Chitinophagales bacterium]